MLYPRKLIVKNSEFKSNSRAILDKRTFSGTFPVPNKSRAIRGIQGIPKLLSTLKHYVSNYMHPLQLFFITLA